jgi:3-hydroxyisobutyrate dehydrogenase-like beta-hydroxyacid dehydrogenase
MKERIGFIGLGAMGKPMALNLLKAGFAVTVTYHKNRAPADELAAAGATVVRDVKAVAAASDVVITIVPKDKDIYEVFRGGLLDGLRKGGVVIDMTSALPDTVKAVAAEAILRGIDVLDAPVSGGVKGAHDGTLTIMVGGTPEVFERCLPVLQAMGKTIYHTGELGSGKAVKMINQVLNAGNTLVASEAIYLAQQMGVDMEMLVKVVNQSSGGSWVFANAALQSIVPQSFKPGFRLELMRKDIGLSLNHAREQGISLPVLTLVGEIFQAMMNQGHGDDNFTVVSQWVRQQNEATQEHD